MLSIWYVGRKILGVEHILGGGALTFCFLHLFYTILFFLFFKQQQVVLDNPCNFANPFQFEITFECLQELEDGEFLMMFFFKK